MTLATSPVTYNLFVLSRGTWRSEGPGEAVRVFQSTASFRSADGQVQLGLCYRIRDGAKEG